MVELERREAAIFVNHTVRIALCTAATFIPVASLAAQSDYLTRLERDIVAEHNLARSDPASYAAYLRELKPRYDGHRFLNPTALCE